MCGCTILRCSGLCWLSRIWCSPLPSILLVFPRQFRLRQSCTQSFWGRHEIRCRAAEFALSDRIFFPRCRSRSSRRFCWSFRWRGWCAAFDLGRSSHRTVHFVVCVWMLSRCREKCWFRRPSSGPRSPPYSRRPRSEWWALQITLEHWCRSHARAAWGWTCPAYP